MAYKYHPYSRLSIIKGNLGNAKRFFFNRWKLNSILSCKPFFIVGAGRSGNTLLRAILCGHKDIGIPPESYIIGPAIIEWLKNNYLRWENLVSLILGQIATHEEFDTWEIDLNKIAGELRKLPDNRKSFAAIIDKLYCVYNAKYFPGAKRWGDKTPLNTFYLEWIERAFPDAQFIIMIRDGRDSASSYYKTGLVKDIEDGCRIWNDAMACVERLDPKKSIRIKYERLVNNTEFEIRKVCSFLKIEFQSEMLDHTKRFYDLGDVPKRKHHKNLLLPITNKNIGKWKKDLTEKEKKVIDILLSETLTKHGYKK